MQILDRISWTMAIALCAFLGLAPFAPEPHLWEKLKMLADGSLARPIDIFDLALHGAPWVIFVLKAFRESAKVQNR